MTGRASESITVRRTRREWAAMLQSLGRCRSELLSEAMAYREPGAWEDVRRIDAFIDLLDASLRPDGAPDTVAITLPLAAWAQHADAFLTGVEDVRESYEYGQHHPDWLANFPDKAAYPSIEADRLAFQATLPADWSRHRGRASA